jgi:hypothetical protein
MDSRVRGNDVEKEALSELPKAAYLFLAWSFHYESTIGLRLGASPNLKPLTALILGLCPRLSRLGALRVFGKLKVSQTAV